MPSAAPSPSSAPVLARVGPAAQPPGANAIRDPQAFASLLALPALALPAAGEATALPAAGEATALPQTAGLSLPMLDGAASAQPGTGIGATTAPAAPHGDAGESPAVPSAPQNGAAAALKAVLASLEPVDPDQDGSSDASAGADEPCPDSGAAFCPDTGAPTPDGAARSDPPSPSIPGAVALAVVISTAGENAVPSAASSSPAVAAAASIRPAASRDGSPGAAAAATGQADDAAPGAPLAGAASSADGLRKGGAGAGDVRPKVPIVARGPYRALAALPAQAGAAEPDAGAHGRGRPGETPLEKPQLAGTFVPQPHDTVLGQHLDPQIPPVQTPYAASLAISLPAVAPLDAALRGFANAGPAPAAAGDPSVRADAAVPLSGIALEIATRALEGKQRFDIRLDPPELGRIDVRLDVARDGQVTSRLVVERAETLDLLRRDAPALERALQSAGLRTDQAGLEFSLRDQSGSHRPAPEYLPRPHVLIVPDEDVAVREAVRRGYGVLRGLGSGVDIRV